MAGNMVDQSLYKMVLGQFSTGVVVVTASDNNGGITGLTVNAFSAVSMEPPLVMVCPQKTSLSCQAILQQQKFAVNILSANQADTAWAFAKREVDTSLVEWHTSEQGIAILNESLAVIECRVWQNYDGGDHHILVGEILHMANNEADGEPLIFHKGKMRSLP